VKIESSDVLALAVVVGLGGAHLLPPVLSFLRLIPRSRALSAAGGVSVGYVFVHLLPEVAEAQTAVDHAARGVLTSFERHAWVAALAGLLVFYGLERAAVATRRGKPDGDGPVPAVFLLSVISFAAYNGIVGYLVVRRAEDAPAGEVVLFGLALGLHFIVNDLGLRHHYRARYDGTGRPVLVGAILAGWLAGVAVDASEAVLGLVVAFLAGGIVLNVLKEEVPEERDSRFLPLAAGAVVYAALLLAV
jgi:hypothetical protein